MTEEEALGYCAACRDSSKHRETLFGRKPTWRVTCEHDSQRSCTTAISSALLEAL